MRIEETAYYKEMNINRTGNLLAGARLKKELTQRKLSEMTGLPQSVISDYEKGRRKITRQAAIRLSSALKVPEAYLL
jgi:transcriptional regulator with XRE-family HTH domain